MQTHFRWKAIQVEVEFSLFRHHSCRMKWFGIFIATTATFLAGCQKETPVSSPEIPFASQPVYPTEAQPKLPTIKLWIGPEEMEAEMALTERQVQTGMMFRTNIAENAGMIFVLEYPYRNGFWMKNCFIPLSLAYIDSKGVIREIHDLEPQNTNSVPVNSDDIQFALETSRGWFARHHISTGALVRTEKGSLRETFFRTRQ